MAKYLYTIGGFEPKTKCDFLTILWKRNNNPEADSVLHSMLTNRNFTEEDITHLLQVYLERGSDHHDNNKNEEKVLFMAFAGKMRNIIDILLRKFSYFIDKLDDEGNSITHHFVENEEKKFLELLNIPGDEHHAALLLTQTIENETRSFVEWLIAKGFDFDRRNNEGKSASVLSVEYNLQHISVVLLKYSREVLWQNHLNRSLLHMFFDINTAFRHKWRLDERKIEWYNAYTSRYASDIVETLLDKGISALAPDIWNRSPLCVAMKEGEDMNVVELMIEHLLKTENNSTEVLVQLIKGCEWWEKSRAEYFLNTLRNLTSKGADVNAKDENGMTLLHWACHAKNYEAIKILDEHGANFDVLTYDMGENLFHALAKKTENLGEPNDIEQEKLVDFLVNKACCNVNAKTKTDKNTPLHLASASGYLAIVRKLIEHGAEVDCRNANRETPLHLAVNCHSEKVADLLLESGADVNSKDKRGLWPLYHASTSREKPSMAPVLLKWGAYVNAKLIRGKRESAFSRAIRFDSWFEVKEMLDYGGDVNDDCVVSLVKSDSVTPEMRYYLIQLWFKLVTAKLPATTKYADIATSFENREIREKRLAELEAMKKTLVDDRVSIYSYMHMDFGRRRDYLNCEQLKNLVKSPKLKTQFPEYAVLIRASYHESVMWKSLLEPAKRGWIKLTGIRLLEECLEQIFAYLKNEDLVGMVKYGK